MKNYHFPSTLAVILLSVAFGRINLPQTYESVPKFTIILHGGVGTISKEMPDSIKQAYLQSLSDALSIGKKILQNGGSSLDAVEQVVRFLEDDPKFNAGKGAVYTSDGKHELDASIMDGRDLSCGAVTCVKR